MNARRFEISRARLEWPMMKDTWQLLNEFIMVCSWDLMMIGFTEKFWSCKTRKWRQELVFFPHSLQGAGQCVWYAHVRVYRSEWSHSGCDVRRKLPFAFSQHWGFLNFVWLLHWRVFAALPRRLHRNCQEIVRFGGLWPSQYLSVQHLPSLACLLLFFYFIFFFFLVIFFVIVVVSSSSSSSSILLCLYPCGHYYHHFFSSFFSLPLFFFFMFALLLLFFFNICRFLSCRRWRMHIIDACL